MMISKGLKSREEILHQLRLLFNKEGTGVTFADLAQKLGTTKGKITYHFPTKDHLFIALGNQYLEQLKKLTATDVQKEFDFGNFYTLAQRVMDLQYKYRCVLRYIASTVRTQHELGEHISKNFRADREAILQVFKILVETGSLDKSILVPENFEVTLFHFTSLFTFWVITLEIYDTERTYEEMKSVYLRGIFSCFTPYLTRKGQEEMERVP